MNALIRCKKHSDRVKFKSYNRPIGKWPKITFNLNLEQVKLVQELAESGELKNLIIRFEMEVTDKYPINGRIIDTTKLSLPDINNNFSIQGS